MIGAKLKNGQNGWDSFFLNIRYRLQNKVFKKRKNLKVINNIEQFGKN